MHKRIQKTMTKPVHLLFRYYQSRSRIQIWLYQQPDLRIEGRILGFDEFMNIVLDEAEEYHVKKNTRTPVGRIMLKGDNVALVCNISYFDTHFC